MKKKTLSLGDITQIEIAEIHGDIRVTGRNQNEILAKTSGDLLELLENGKKLTLKCDGDLIIFLPNTLEIIVADIHGDARFSNLSLPLTLAKIGGDLNIRKITQAKINQIGGDLIVRQAASLNIKAVGGDASLRKISGNLNIAGIGSDLHLQDLLGNLNAKVGDDAILYIHPQEGATYHLSAGDDILLRLPENADVALDLQAGDELLVDYLDVEEADEKQRRKLELGLATAKMTLSAGGDLRVTSASEPWADAASFDIPLPFLDADFPQLADDFAEKISRKMDTFPDEIFDEISTHLDDFPDRFTERISRKLDSKFRESEKKMRKAEKKMRQAEQKQKRENFTPENWGKKGKSTPVSNDERLLILKMLEEKKISAEDAGKLLAALES